MDIAEIRKENMLSLLDNYRTQAEFADLVGTEPAYISQLKKGIKKTGERVTMGDTLARSIETALNLPYGWMDRQNGATIHNQFNNNGYVGGSVSQSVVNNYASQLTGGDDWLTIVNNDMFPAFAIGDQVRIDAKKEVEAGNYVYVDCEGKKMLRKYRPKGYDENGTLYTHLVADNEDYPVIDSRHQAFTVLGVAVEYKRKLV